MSLDTKTLKDEAQRLIDIQSADPRMGALYRHEYLKVATPEAVLALIAENDELSNAGSQLRAFFVDATEQCCKAERERDQSEQDYKDVVGTIELRDIEITKLRAEVAGLRTGYEAYERVNAELNAEVEESASVIDQLAKIIAGVAVALKGEELPLRRHSYHDLVECVTVLKLENDLRMADSEALRQALLAARQFIMHEAEVRGLLDESNEVSFRHPRRQAAIATIDAALGKGEQP